MDEQMAKNKQKYGFGVDGLNREYWNFPHSRNRWTREGQFWYLYAKEDGELMVDAFTEEGAEHLRWWSAEGYRYTYSCEAKVIGTLFMQFARRSSAWPLYCMAWGEGEPE
jgi:hypothetical protein